MRKKIDYNNNLKKRMEKEQSWKFPKEKSNKTPQDLFDAEHPNRQKAIQILEKVQKYLCRKCIKNTDGVNWYELEDYITLIISNKSRKPKTKK